MKIGVISDTHNFFDPRIPGLFAGVDHILHGGDVGQGPILQQLEEIAPVTAVCGNTDDPGFEYPLTAVVVLENKKFLLHHIVDPRDLYESLERRIRSEKPDAVIFGHTHKPFRGFSDGIFYLNPGYAGKTRFNLERSVVLLQWDDAGPKPEFIKL